MAQHTTGPADASALAAVLGALEAAERLAGIGPPTAATFAVEGRTLTRRDEPGPGEVASGSTPAQRILVGKFSNAATPRARAFYDTPGAGRTLWLDASPASRDAVRRWVRAQRRWGATAVGLPRLLGAGHAGGLGWVLEETVPGAFPTTDESKQVVAASVLPSLLDGYGTVAVAPRPLGYMMSRRHLVAGVRRFVDAVPGRQGWPEPERLLATARRLARAPGLAARSLGHGDLVFSNLLAAGDRIHLVDWEHSRPMAIASDLVKLVAATPRPDDVLEQVLAGWPRQGAAWAPPSDQLAAACLLSISWWAGRREQAAASGREAPLDRWLEARLALLERLGAG